VVSVLPVLQLQWDDVGEAAKYMCRPARERGHQPEAAAHADYKLIAALWPVHSGETARLALTAGHAKKEFTRGKPGAN
jgi:hypothetical protein